MEEKLLRMVRSTANLLRGMTMDPAIPKRVREVFEHRIERMDELTDECDNDPESL